MCIITAHDERYLESRRCSMATRKRRLSSVSSSSDEEQDCGVDSRAYTQSNRRFCPHCHQYLVLKTYRAHKGLYFSEVRALICAWLNNI